MSTRKIEELPSAHCEFNVYKQKIDFLPEYQKCKVTLAIKLKTSEECLVYPCVPEQRDLPDEGVFQRDAGGKTGRILLTLRPSTPGNGSENAYYVSVLDNETGQGTTYKVGLLNAPEDSASSALSTYFVRCLITTHSLSLRNYDLYIESFTDNVPLMKALGNLSRSRKKELAFPEKHKKLKFMFPNRPREEFTAKNLLFDLFDGQGIALTYQNTISTYEISYLRVRRRDGVFVEKHDVLEKFYSIPNEDKRHPGATHRAVPFGTFLTRTVGGGGKNKLRGKYSDSRYKRLFGDYHDKFTLGDLPTFRTMMDKLALEKAKNN